MIEAEKILTDEEHKRFKEILKENWDMLIMSLMHGDATIINKVVDRLLSELPKKPLVKFMLFNLINRSVEEVLTGFAKDSFSERIEEARNKEIYT